MRDKLGAIRKLSLPKRIIAGVCNFKGPGRPGPVRSEGGLSYLKLGVGPGCGFLTPPDSGFPRTGC